MTFATAIQNQTARTTNGMKARASSANACVDLFYAIGASRGKNIIPLFAAAFAENAELATRIALWARDVRGGAGERKLFRDILNHLEVVSPETARRVLDRTPELGRWDDVLAVKSPALRDAAFAKIHQALYGGDGLCAKWMPRKGEVAAEIRKALGLTPKAYRKLIVGLTKVVETQMCAKDWDSINFEQVPSIAAARYRNAFVRNTPKYQDYVSALTKGEAKVNASSIYPHEVVKSVLSKYGCTLSSTEAEFIRAQWKALPNFIGDANILPMVDVSGSMFCPAGGSKTVQCIDVAVALGLYCADKNSGAFKDLFLTFSSHPELLTLRGDIISKISQMQNSSWGMSTNILAAFSRILEVAKKGKVSQADMPKYLVIFSDMQFDHCASYDDSAMESLRRQFNAAGYTAPKIIFWNLNHAGNTPVSYREDGAALVSGFSPALMKALLSDKLEQFTPENVMLQTVMVERYNF